MTILRRVDCSVKCLWFLYLSLDFFWYSFVQQVQLSRTKNDKEIFELLTDLKDGSSISTTVVFVCGPFPTFPSNHWNFPLLNLISSNTTPTTNFDPLTRSVVRCISTAYFGTNKHLFCVGVESKILSIFHCGAALLLDSPGNPCARMQLIILSGWEFIIGAKWMVLVRGYYEYSAKTVSSERVERAPLREMLIAPHAFPRNQCSKKKTPRKEGRWRCTVF